MVPHPRKKRCYGAKGRPVAAATTPDYGDVVLAELTQPFNAADISYFRPLHQQSVMNLQRFPTYLTADAAFDAWWVYHQAALHGGIAAVPLNSHSKRPPVRDPDGVPRCSKGLRMHPLFSFAHTSGYRALHFGYPLLFPSLLVSHVTTNNSRKAKVVSKILTGNVVGYNESSSIAVVRSTRRFT